MIPHIFFEWDHYLFELVTGLIGWVVGHKWHDRRKHVDRKCYHPFADLAQVSHLTQRVQRLEATNQAPLWDESGEKAL